MMPVTGTDASKGKVMFAQPKAPKEKKVTAEVRPVHISEATYAKLLDLAYVDGYRPNSGTLFGATGQATRIVQRYIVMAIDNLFTMRHNEMEVADLPALRQAAQDSLKASIAAAKAALQPEPAKMSPQRSPERSPERPAPKK